MIWYYKNYLNCDRKNVVYTLMCNTCEWFYLGQTNNLKQRIRKHKSDVFHPWNSFFKKYSEYFCSCRRIKEPFFRIYQILFDNEKELCEFERKTFHYEMETTGKYLSLKCINNHS